MTAQADPVTFRVDDGVYAPQEDSWLLREVLVASGLAEGRRVLDICTGSGILAVEAGRQGAREVLAFDISAAAVACATHNTERAGVRADVRLGSVEQARLAGPYGLVLSNPPYVPSERPPEGTGPNRAWDAGTDGRAVLDDLCRHAPGLLAARGSMLLVQSEFAGPERTVRMLHRTGLRARAVAVRTVDFGPVMTAYAERLEATGLLEPGRRTEELVVIRVDRR